MTHADAPRTFDELARKLSAVHGCIKALEAEETKEGAKAEEVCA